MCGYSSRQITTIEKCAISILTTVSEVYLLTLTTESPHTAPDSLEITRELLQVYSVALLNEV